MGMVMQSIVVSLNGLMVLVMNPLHVVKRVVYSMMITPTHVLAVGTLWNVDVKIVIKKVDVILGVVCGILTQESVGAVDVIL
jgi:hypothetical protein